MFALGCSLGFYAAPVKAQENGPQADTTALQARGEVSSWYSSFRDSDKSRLSQYNTAAKIFADQNQNFQYIFTRGNYRDIGVDHVYENRHSLAWGWNKEDVALKLLYKYRDWAKLKDSHNYALEGSSPVGWLQNVSVGHSYDHTETAKAILHKIKFYKNYILINQALNERWSVASYFQRNLYNDGNRRTMIREGIYYALWQKPLIKLGYEFVSQDSKSTSPHYWSPHKQRTHQGKLSFSGAVLSSKLRYDLSYYFGFAQAKGEEDIWIHSGAATLTYQLSKNWNIFFNMENSTEPTYRYYTFDVGFRFQF